MATVGVMRTSPAAPGAAGTAIVRRSGPSANETRPAAAVPPSSAASCASQASRAVVCCSTWPSQCASATTPSCASSCSGSGGTALPSRKPTRPASAASGPPGSAAACARARPRTRSSTDDSSESRSDAARVRSRGAGAPGICRPRKASENSGGAPPAPVGTEIARATPPRRAWPATAGAASVVMSNDSVARAAALPSRIGVATLCPSLAARKSGTCADNDACGAVEATRTPTPMATKSAPRSSNTA